MIERGWPKYVGIYLQQMKVAFVAAALAALTIVVVDAGESKAAIFNIGGQNYDVTSFTGSYDGDTSKFNTPGNGGVMPWWGNSSLAQQFATTVGSSLPGSFPPEGAFFAYNSSVELWLYIDSSTIFNSSALSFGNFVYAQATLVPPPSSGVPGPLPFLGAATAFGMSRRLRQRIATQSHKL